MPTSTWAKYPTIEKITAATTAHVCRFAAGTRGAFGAIATVSCPCVFPDDAAPETRHVLLVRGSRGAQMTPTKLGSLLARALTPQLTDENLRMLVDGLQDASGRA